MSNGTFIPVNTTNKYKDKQGRYLTRGLFKETCFNDNVEPSYTLGDEDKDNLLSMKKLYLECRDPTEMKAAQVLLGSWNHWKRLCDCDWFQEHIQDWREELEVLLRSEGITTIVEASKKKDAVGVAAAKWLVEKGWAPKSEARGRPSKAEVERQASIQARIQGRVDDHLKLISGIN